MEIVLIIIAIIFILAITIFVEYNNIIKLKLKVEQARSGIDIYLKERFDLIPNLVQTVKKYTEHESSLLESITELRSKYNETKDLKISEELNAQLNQLMVVAESYPDLQATEHFINLQKNLSKMESQLQAARRIYNSEVTAYNTKIKTLPYNIVASIFKFEEEKLFEIKEEEKENVNVGELFE